MRTRLLAQGFKCFDNTLLGSAFTLVHTTVLLEQRLLLRGPDLAPGLFCVGRIRVMMVDSQSIRRIALRIIFVVPFLMNGSAPLLLAQGAPDYIVRFRDGTTAPIRAAAIRNAGASATFNFHRVNAAAVTVPSANALAALQNDPSVAAVIPNRAVSAYQFNENGKGESAKGKPGRRREAEEEGQRSSFPPA